MWQQHTPEGLSGDEGPHQESLRDMKNLHVSYNIVRRTSVKSWRSYQYLLTSALSSSSVALSRWILSFFRLQIVGRVVSCFISFHELVVTTKLRRYPRKLASEDLVDSSIAMLSVQMKTSTLSPLPGLATTATFSCSMTRTVVTIFLILFCLPMSFHYF